MLDKIVRSLILMLLGASIYGFLIEAAKVYSSRSSGNIGGEIFVLPLRFGRVWLGCELRANVKRK